MNDEVVLALDQGTTSSRTLAFDRQGTVVASAQQEFPQHFPNPGWVEHDGGEIWRSQLATLRQVQADLVELGKRPVAIGITNQRETTLIWDRVTGEPIHPAIVWQDRRTADFCERLKADGHEASFRVRTGLRLDPYFSGTKVKWILDQVPGARERALKGELCFGTIDSWLLWKLTQGAVHATDVTNASRTLLFNLETLAWDSELCKTLDIPMALLPEVKECSHLFGEWEGIPITGIAGDQHAALFGQECFHSGMAKSTYGTGCFLLMNTGSQPVHSHNGLLSTVAWTLNGETSYALEGSVFMAGAIFQWLREGLGLIEDASEVATWASQCEGTGGVTLVPAFTGLGAPHWRPEAKAALLGMSRGTGKAEICRAAMESIAFQCGEVLQAMVKDSGVAVSELRVDGGVARSDLMLQMQADLIATPVVRPRCLETTALGAAGLAGLQVGYWKSQQELAGLLGNEETFQAEKEDTAMDWARWHQAVSLVKSACETGLPEQIHSS